MEKEFVNNSKDTVKAQSSPPEDFSWFHAVALNKVSFHSNCKPDCFNRTVSGKFMEDT